MSDLSKFRPSKENQGVEIKAVRCDTYSSSFESLYNTYTTYCEDFPDSSWFPDTWWFDEKEKRAKMDHVLFDGQQRFTAILDFLTGKFPITFEGKQFYVTDLSYREWLNIKRYPISIANSYIEDWNDLIDYYILINKGGTQHTDEEFRKALDFKEN